MIIKNKTLRDKLRLWLDTITTMLGLLSGIALVAEVGFYLPVEWHDAIVLFISGIVVFFIGQEVLRWLFITGNIRTYAKERWLEHIIIVFLLINLIYPDPVHTLLLALAPSLSVEQLTLAYLAITEGVILGSLLIKAVRYNKFLARIKLPPGAVFALSFGVIITFGTLSLLLPKATTNGLSVTQALFTTTSAVCVTGLTVVDTATAFTPLGHVILLGLIQIGGLGVMTLTTFFAMFFAGGISIRERLMMSTILNQENVGEVSGLLIRIAVVALTIEFFGAVSLYISAGGTILQPDAGLFFISLFHSISAFCNAGFSLYTNNLAEGIIRGNYIHHSIVMVLIVLGGLGFAVINDIARIHRFRNKYHISKIALATKVVLVSTGSLLLVGSLLALIAENNNAFAGLSWWEKPLQALFLSVTCRTAGFNILPMDAISQVFLLPMMALMWVGASPGSTGGGIKTTTLAVAALNVWDTIKGKHRLELFYREIPPDTARTALSIILLSLLVLGISSTLLVLFEPKVQPILLLFEAVSALSTVGLSYNLTPTLSVPSQYLLMFLMFIGRIGVLSFITAFVKNIPEEHYRYPYENVPVM